MNHAQHSAIVSFIWSIADDVLHHNFDKVKYRDVILPMTVIRRLDALLEDTKDAVLSQNKMLDEIKVVNKDAALRAAAGQAFYNTCPFTLKQLQNVAKRATLKQDFEAYLDGFSPNVQDILENFQFRNQVPRLASGDLIGGLLEKFLDTRYNLSPKPVFHDDGTVKIPGLDNHAMGTIFEELLRRFNEANNEAAGEHWTPRDVVTLMADLILVPVVDTITPGVYTLYDGACGTGGMLTVAEDRLKVLAGERNIAPTIHVYGQEVNPETYAIAKADLLIKGEGAEADNIKLASTLSRDQYPAGEYDFLLSNPPYGVSWKKDLANWDGKENIDDPRFVLSHADDPEYSLVTRSSDGQLMFLVNMLAKMKTNTPHGSRIAEVHNGSSLFTGDAGQGESNIRRWICENDYLEAIIALPLNIFYNTGIATYIWVLTNRKPEPRRGKVQLIDATQWFRPLRKNLGKKNCELSPDDQTRILDTFLAFAETPESRIFPNDAFGYSKITVERPLRLTVDLAPVSRVRFRDACDDEPLANLIDRLALSLGEGPHQDYNAFLRAVETAAAAAPTIKLPAKRHKLLQTLLAVRDESAAPVVRRVHKPGKSAAVLPIVADPFHGFYAAPEGAYPAGTILEYEPDADLRDTEQVPLLEDGGVAAFVAREVLPYVPDAWVNPDATRVGYEVSFTRYFYQPQVLRTLEEIREDIEGLERETEGLFEALLFDTGKKS